jgi:hypothetical protein
MLTAMTNDNIVSAKKQMAKILMSIQMPPQVPIKETSLNLIPPLSRLRTTQGINLRKWSACSDCCQPIRSRFGRAHIYHACKVRHTNKINNEATHEMDSIIYIDPVMLR